jgi:hypothetical protein
MMVREKRFGHCSPVFHLLTAPSRNSFCPWQSRAGLYGLRIITVQENVKLKEELDKGENELEQLRSAISLLHSQIDQIKREVISFPCRISVLQHLSNSLFFGPKPHFLCIFKNDAFHVCTLHAFI